MDNTAIAAALRQAASECEADHLKGAPVGAGAIPPWLKTLLTTLLPFLLQLLSHPTPTPPTQS